MQETSSKVVVREKRRVAAIVEYHGANFHGWQRQKHHPEPTIQAALEDALSRVAKDRTTIIIAHRLHTLDICDTLVIFKDGKIRPF